MYLIVEKIISKVFVFYLKTKGLKTSGKMSCRYGFDIPRYLHKVLIGHRTNFDRNFSIILSKTESNHDSVFLVEIGNRVYFNRYTIIDASTSIKIGDDTMIGPYCYITDHDHDFKGAPITQPIGELPLNGMPTIIEDNVWIGSHVTILKGVTIGKNSIIGAGSIVTKSIPENSVAVGNPCKVLKERK